MTYGFVCTDATNYHQVPGIVTDFVGSWYWKEHHFDDFVRESWKNVVLLFWGDGTELFQHGSPMQRSAVYALLFSVFAIFSSTDSVCSFSDVSLDVRHYAVQLYNLPLELRSKFQFVLLWMIVSGPKKPKSVRYLQKLLMDEVVESWKNEVGSAHSSVFSSSFCSQFFLVFALEDFRLRIGLGVADGPFIAEMRNCVCHSGSACKCCQMLAEYFPFAGTHKWCPSRRLLPPDHIFREAKAPFTSEEQTPQPLARTHEEIMAAALHPVPEETSVKGRNEFMVFTKEQFDQAQGFMRDPFHILKNTSADMSKLLVGKDDSKDPLTQQVNKLWKGPEGPEKKVLAIHRLKDAHVCITLIGRRLGNLFSSPAGLNAHELTMFASYLMKVALVFLVFFLLFYPSSFDVRVRVFEIHRRYLLTSCRVKWRWHCAATAITFSMFRIS